MFCKKEHFQIESLWFTSKFSICQNFVMDYQDHDIHTLFSQLCTLIAINAKYFTAYLQLVAMKQQQNYASRVRYSECPVGF